MPSLAFFLKKGFTLKRAPQPRDTREKETTRVLEPMFSFRLGEVYVLLLPQSQSQQTSVGFEIAAFERTASGGHLRKSHTGAMRLKT